MLVNRVANSGLTTINLEDFFPTGEIAHFDLVDYLFMGLILNELITNSFKHAFSEGQEGFINLRIHRADDDKFDLQYSDNGQGIPEEKLTGDTGTLGRSLIESLVEQLDGFMTLESDGTGTRYHIRFKVS